MDIFKPRPSEPDGSEVRSGISGHVAALDGIRGVAIAIVLIHNASSVLGDSTLFLPKLAGIIVRSGWLGVQLFFALSGFLITSILMDARGSRGFFRIFYVRRMLRIFPLYYIFLAAAFFVVPALFFLPSWTAVARANQWWFWTYTSNWRSGADVRGLAHFWSLAVEEQFYLLWPLLIFVFSSRALIGLCVTALLTSPLIRFGLRASGWPASAAYQFTIARWDALAAGAVVAILLLSGQGRSWLRKNMKRIGSVAVLSLAVVVVLSRGFAEDGLGVQVLGQSLISVISAAFIYICVTPLSSLDTAVRRLVEARWLRFLGKYSYAIYVLHFPMQRILSPLLSDTVNGADTNWRLLRLAVYVGGLSALSIFAAMISWRVLEKPFLDLKDRFAPRGLSIAKGGQ